MRLRYAPRAHADITEIYQYILRHDARAATGVIQRIRTTSELLAQFPDLGRETDLPGVRVFPIVRYPYLIDHRVFADELTIIHVRHARRDKPEQGEL